jgi:hypothetical protein
MKNAAVRGCGSRNESAGLLLLLALSSMATIVGTLRRLLVNGFRCGFHPGQREFRMRQQQVPAHKAKLAKRMAARISRKPVGSKVEGELHTSSAATSELTFCWSYHLLSYLLTRIHIFRV